MTVDRIDRIFMIFGIAMCLLSLIASFEHFSWFIELFVHFRFQYLVVLIVLGFWFLARIKLAWVFIFWGVGLINAPPLAARLMHDQHVVSSATEEITFFHLNVQEVNKKKGEAVEYISKIDPDIISLVELDPTWGFAFDALKRKWPHSIEKVEDQNFGVAIMSKYPLLDSKLINSPGLGRPSAVARIAVGEKEFTVISTHPQSPMSKHKMVMRDLQLTHIESEVVRTEGPLVLLGDMNLTPWSFKFFRFLKTTELVDAAKGFKIVYTWPASFFPLGIPIDHVLISSDWSVVDYQAGKSIGSDHLPLIVKLKL